MNLSDVWLKSNMLTYEDFESGYRITLISPIPGIPYVNISGRPRSKFAPWTWVPKKYYPTFRGRRFKKGPKRVIKHVHEKELNRIVDESIKKEEDRVNKLKQSRRRGRWK